MTAPGDHAPGPDDPYERAPCGLLSTHAGGAIERVNATFCRWVGRGPDGFVGRKRLQDLLTIGCKIFHQTHWMPLLQLQGSVAEVQLDFVDRAGTTLPMLVNAQTRVEGDAVKYDVAVFLATDRRKYERELLAARRHAEELLSRERAAQDALKVASARLHLALDSARLFVWDVDVATGEPTYEPGVRQLLGLPPEAVLTVDAYRTRVHPDDREAERTALADALASGGAGVYTATYRLLGHDGVERIISSSGRTFYDEAGRPKGFSGVLQDVTNWRRAEEVMRDREQESRQRAVLAEQLVGIVSHDLRTPLQAVVLGANLLAAGGLTPAQTRTVQRVTSAASRANRLIADLLDFTQSRLGEGLRVTCCELDLHALVADVVEELKLVWPGRMMEHHRRGEGVGWADPDRLSQVVTNLATNALTYGVADRPITVVSSVGEGELAIEVHNEGPPIPPNLLPHIFEPLRRGEQQVRLGSRSVGLGLYIVHEIAAAHAGRVTVRSSDGEGTTFTVSVRSKDVASPG